MRNLDLEQALTALAGKDVKAFEAFVAELVAGIIQAATTMIPPDELNLLIEKKLQGMTDKLSCVALQRSLLPLKTFLLEYKIDGGEEFQKLNAEIDQLSSQYYQKNDLAYLDENSGTIKFYDTPTAQTAKQKYDELLEQLYELGAQRKIVFDTAITLTHLVEKERQERQTLNALPNQEDITKELTATCETTLRALITEINETYESASSLHYAWAPKHPTKNAYRWNALRDWQPESNLPESIFMSALCLGIFDKTTNFKTYPELVPLANLCNQYNAIKKLHDILIKQTDNNFTFGHKIQAFKKELRAIKESTIRPTSRVTEFFKNIGRALSNLFRQKEKRPPCTLFSRKSLAEAAVATTKKITATITLST